MDMFVVQGGTPLSGAVEVSGSKNAALPIMAATLMAEGETVLKNVPELADVRSLCALLETLGGHSNRKENGDLHFEVHDHTSCLADYELVRKMRASVCVLGPLLAKRKRACVSLPGGCNIGDRPINLHLKGLAALGADIRIERGYVIAEAKQLRGNAIYLGGPFGSTVTGTCNVMAAATLAKGKTTIESAACEPEVVNFGGFLNRMGADITGLGTPFVEIDGVSELTGTTHTIISDRIETATLMMAAAITHGSVRLRNAPISHMTSVIEKLKEIGVIVVAKEGSISIQSTGTFKPSDCIALPYPGIPTDVQAQLTALLCLADGISVVTDKIFPDRFMHASELVRLGATIRRQGSSAIINGVKKLSGAAVMASDLRASAALVLAALAAEGESIIRRIYHLERGYEQLERKLNTLGANIRRVKDIPENMPASLTSPIDADRQHGTIDGPHWHQTKTQSSELR